MGAQIRLRKPNTLLVYSDEKEPTGINAEHATINFRNEA
jgi:hypothetical protein